LTLLPHPALISIDGSAITEVFGVSIGYSSCRDAIAFAILVLLFRPTGLLGRKIQRKV